MNQRNVDALEEVLRLLGAAEVEEGYGHFTRQQAAQWLASQGVLVPAALTEDNVWAAWSAPAEGPEPLYNVDHWKNLPAELGRIAKGEA